MEKTPELVWRVDKWRAELKANKDKKGLMHFREMEDLTRRIFAAALIKHSNLNEAVMSVYLTGLYHAVELSREAEDDKKTL